MSSNLAKCVSDVVEHALFVSILLHLKSVSSCSSLACYPASLVSLWLPATQHCDSVQTRPGSASDRVASSPLLPLYSTSEVTSLPLAPFFLYNLQLSWLLCLFVLTFLPATDPGSSTEDFHKELWPSFTQYLKKRIIREQNFYIFLYFMSLATLTLSLISLLLPVREEIIVLYINYCVYYAEIILLLIIFLIY